MAKRGTTDLSLMVAVDKPSGLTSHDVVNRVRRIFGERRVGHTGTLDPLASGVLPVCIGPATRLDNYLVGHDKSYVVSIVFGAATDTDDAAGAVIRTGEVPEEVFDPFFATTFVASLVGKSKQLPPVYSAIKVGGKKACDEARRGRVIDLTPRDIEVLSAELLGIWGADGTEAPRWDVAFTVSAGTYIRSLARDAGNALGCPAHVGALRRTAVGSIALDECVSLETLEDIGLRAALDPLRALGCRFAYVDGDLAAKVRNGNPLAADALTICERRCADAASELCACTAGVRESCEPLSRDETIALVYDNRVIALYAYDAARHRLAPRCVFPIGVIRGYSDL
ncbi:tRNA pseudouridine(55) synthase TruB [Adlercreutzia caecimuris]|uniref:tRNA pseudouridine(55) synthase TruB n=1 Tax=Adlercreutzia caecimuris TaxID=671266 RepID=UPI002494C787|nr:tRNA pseudouridine(55) synthase TruB [Adlercreutzia caecimuris]